MEYRRFCMREIQKGITNASSIITIGLHMGLGNVLVYVPGYVLGYVPDYVPDYVKLCN